MTGNCAALQSLADEPGRVQMNPADAQRLGIADKQLVWVSSRRGKVISRADLSDRINPGAVYMTYQWWVGACNELTQDNLDPISKTPETKYCAVKVEAIADQQWAERYAWTAYSDMKARLKAAADVRPQGAQRAPSAAAGGLRRRQLFLHQPHPHGDAGADQRIVKVIAGVMQRLRRGFAVGAYPEIGPRTGLQHAGKIFGGH